MIEFEVPESPRSYMNIHEPCKQMVLRRVDLRQTSHLVSRKTSVFLGQANVILYVYVKFSDAYYNLRIYTYVYKNTFWWKTHI